VENASFFPWLTGTAFLHSVMMQEKRGMMKVWNVWLIFITFMLSILGTLLTRSGLVSSVHAFAQSSIGSWFFSFLGIVIAVCLVTYIVNYKHLEAENKLQSLVSRESSFLFNNLVLLAVTFAILCGTLFPILSDWVRGYKITVGPPWFNKFTVPIGLFLAFLTAVGPLLAWGSTSYASIKRNFAFPAAASVLVGVVSIVLNMQPWMGGAHVSAWFADLDLWRIYSWMAIVLSTLVLATVASEFIRGGRVLQGKLNINLFAAMYALTRRNMRRYGGYIAHIGFAVVVIGLAGLAFNQEKEQEMGLGDKLQIGHYTLVGQAYTQDDNANYRSEAALLDVYKDSKLIGQMTPEERFFKANGGQPDHIVGVRHFPLEDLYVIYEGKNPDNGHTIIKARVNPLVSYVWIGVMLLVVGTGLALVPNAAAVRVAVPHAVAVPSAEEGRLQPVGAGK
jgi:cytochrome c-type biogenesis protein CcmF